MDSIKRALESIGRMWAALNATQRVILSVSAAAMVLLLVWGSASSVQTMVRVAGPEVDASKRQEILRKFQERNQKHEVRGTEILVPKEDADRVVLELAGEGTMSTSAVWKFLEQSDIFATRWDKEKRFQIALQTRLEAMIRSVESVKNASVVINPGSTQSQLGFAGPKPSASVQVELKEDAELTKDNVRAIAGLVAKAVSGVEHDQVHIMDTRGRAYRAPKPNSNMDAVEDFGAYETARENKIQKQLKDVPAFSGASVIVRVKARNVPKKTDSVTYGRSAVLETKETTRKKGIGSPAAPKLQKGEGPAETPAEAPAREDETETSTEEKRALDQTHTVEENPGGEIQRITVGILIPVEVGPDNKEMVEAEKQLPKLREFALYAAGPPTKSEDVSVQLIPTRRPEPLVAQTASDGLWVWLSLHASRFALFGLALAGLFVLLRVVQTVMARDTVEEIQSLTAALTETQEAGVDLLGPAAGELGRLKQNVQEMVGRSPQSVAASLKSFMSGR